MRRKGKNPERDLALGALLPSLFYPSQAASFALPGAGGAEFRFPRNLHRVAGVWLDGPSSVPRGWCSWRSATPPDAEEKGLRIRASFSAGGGATP